MLIRFSISRHSGWLEFTRDVPADVMASYAALPDSQRDRIAWWRQALADLRIDGRAMIWEPVSPAIQR